MSTPVLLSTQARLFSPNIIGIKCPHKRHMTPELPAHIRYWRLLLFIIGIKCPHKRHMTPELPACKRNWQLLLYIIGIKCPHKRHMTPELPACIRYWRLLLFIIGIKCPHKRHMTPELPARIRYWRLICYIRFALHGLLQTRIPEWQRRYSSLLKLFILIFILQQKTGGLQRIN